MLQSIAIFNGRGLVPNSAASPEPPLRFNLNVQSLVSVFDITTNRELTDQTFNMNRGINFDLPARACSTRRFATTPIACSRRYPSTSTARLPPARAGW